MTIRQIITDWATTGGPAQTVMYFSTASGTPASQRTAIHDMWLAFAPQVTTGTSWTVQQSGSEMNEVNGQTTGAWADATAKSSAGTATGQPVADATQMLFQWRTGAFRDGHEVRGRSYVPGVRVNIMVNGEIPAASVTSLNNTLSVHTQSLALQGMVIWHRPVFTGTPPVLDRAGSALPLSSGAVWKELAVLRRRRN